MVAALVLEPLVGSGAKGQGLEYGGALSAATGTFIFSEAATTWTFTNTLQLVGDRWRVGVSVPLITQNSTALSFVGGVPLPTGGPNSGSVGRRTGSEPIPMQRRRGGTGGGGSSVVDSGAVEGLGPFETALGDPVFDVGGDLIRSAGGAMHLGLRLSAKVPIADPASGVGTGAADYGAGATFSINSESAILYADVSHWVLGDLEDLRLSDMTTGSIGVGRSIGRSRRLSVLASAHAATAFTETVDPALSAGIGVGYAVAPTRLLNAGATFGLSESVADWTVSVGWHFGTTRRSWRR